MTKLKFEILESLDTEIMLFADYSDYSSAPTSPTLELKFPNLKKLYTTPVKYGEITTINTARLGYTDCISQFPDGVYEAKFSIGGCYICKKVYRVTEAFSKLELMLRDKSATEFNKDLLEKFNKINLYLHGAMATVEIDETQANALYKQATSLLDCNNLKFDKDVRMFKKCTNCS